MIVVYFGNIIVDWHDLKLEFIQTYFVASMRCNESVWIVPDWSAFDA